MISYKKLLVRKYPLILMTWSFFSWIPYFTQGNYPFFWLLSAPATLSIQIERVLRFNSISHNYYFAFILSLMIGAGLGILLGNNQEKLKNKNTYRRRKRYYR